MASSDEEEEKPDKTVPEEKPAVKKSKSPKKSVSKSPKKVSNSEVEEFKSRIKDLLCRVVDNFDPNTVVDSRSEDFIANRLPPYDKNLGEEMSFSIKLESF